MYVCRSCLFSYLGKPEEYVMFPRTVDKVIVSSPMGAWNQDFVPCKSNNCSQANSYWFVGAFPPKNDALWILDFKFCLLEISKILYFSFNYVSLPNSFYLSFGKQTCKSANKQK